MSKALSLAGFFALVSGIAWGDAIMAGSGSWVNIPTSISGSLGTNVPYWDNPSGDGPDMNAGFFLSGACGIPADCSTNYSPLQYLSQNNGVGQPDAPTNIALVHTSSTAALTVLGTYTSDTSLILGFYEDDDSVLTETPIIGPGSLVGDIGTSITLDIPSGDTYGFYVTRACYSFISGCSGGYTTWYSDSSLDASDVGRQHFTIFDSSTSGIYYIGVEDWLPGTGEGYGDFNDIMFELDTSAAVGPSVPEPATFGMLGAGLVALGLGRLRGRRNGAK